MPKVLVMYDSKTGLTERMAKAVAEGVSEVRGVDVELLKVGTPFSISKLDEADAIIIGSPTHYANVTQEMRAVLESVKGLKKAKKLELSEKIGGAFGSYAWDGGWVINKLGEDMKDLGIRVVAPVVSAVDRKGGFGVRIDEESLKRCHELGRAVAMEFAV